MAVAGAGAALLGAALAPGSAHAAAAVPGCAAAQLSGAVVFDDAAAGNRYGRLVLTNRGGACTLDGFTGLQLVAADGRALPTDAVPRGGDPTVVTLGAGGTAEANLHWILGPCFTAGDDGTPGSLPVAIIVTPPGGAGDLTVPWEFGWVCGDPDGPARIDVGAFEGADPGML